MTTATRAYPCPACERLNDVATPLHTPDATPQRGDPSICFGCATWLIFTGSGFEQRRATVFEVTTIMANPDNARIHTAILGLIEQRRRTPS